MRALCYLEIDHNAICLFIQLNLVGDRIFFMGRLSFEALILEIGIVD